MSLCRGCRKKIQWVLTDVPDFIAPLEIEPVWVLIDEDNGEEEFIMRTGETIHGREVGDAFDDEEQAGNIVEAYRKHTCPESESRKQRRRWHR